MRCFVGIKVSNEYIEAWSNQAKHLSMNLKRSFRLVKPDNLHLTLKFLGEIDDNDALDAFRENLASITSAFAVLDETTQPTLGFLPSTRRARILYHGVSDTDGSIEKLSDMIDSASWKLFGIPRNTRSFLPHITLGRAKNPVNLDPPPEAFSIKFPVDAVTLFESRLKQSGAEYSIIGSFKLGDKT